MTARRSIPAFLRRTQINGIVRTAELDKNYMLVSRWFPGRSVATDEFESLVWVDQVRLAPFVDIDAQTPLMDDDIFGSYVWRVAYMRFKKRFLESDLRILMEPGVSDPNSLVAANAAAAEAKIRRYIDALSQSIDAREEWMAASALGGALAYDDSNVQYSVTYNGFKIGANRVVPTVLWSDASAPIIADISAVIEDLAEETGIESWAGLASRRVMANMSRNTDIKENWNVLTNNPAFTAVAALNPAGGVTASQQLAQATNIVGLTEIIPYNAEYTTQVRQAARVGSPLISTFRFLADTDFFLLPADRPLGSTPTAPAQPNNWQPGKFGWSVRKEDPWVIEAGAGKYSFIDFPGTMHNSLAQMRVL